MKWILLGILFCFPSWGFGSSDSREMVLAHSKKWLRLLHYKSYWFRGHRSSISDPGFFFSPDGAKDPYAELLASVKAFRERSQNTISRIPQPLACAFPARFRFLNEELNLGLKMPDCKSWDEFLGRFHGHDSVTLVFSTAFPNNPASMFGHSFLRINAKPRPGQEKLDLLDYGLGYAAQVPDDENNFLFIWFGLTGGYVGTFSSLPYYAKVAEYVNSESRDLWEYDLNFSKDETWWLLANAWEIEVNSSSPYYFFDENCSYAILTLLEVAKPDWDVSSYLFHNIPGETIKRIVRTSGAVRSVKFRPSLFKKLTAYGERLASNERREFFHWIRGEKTERPNAAVLDAVVQYFYYLKQQNGGVLSSSDNASFQDALVKRATFQSGASPDPVFDERSRPELGHHASRISIGFGALKDPSIRANFFQEVGVKFAYHDLLNSDLGFVPFSEINFPHVRFRYFSSEQRFLVQNLEFLSIYSLSPWSWLKKTFSWHASLAYEVPISICSHCHVLHGEAAIGASHPLANDRARVYELIGPYFEVGKVLKRSWRFGPYFALGLLANPISAWKHRLELRLISDPMKRGTQDNVFATALWGQSWFFSPEIEARLQAKAAIGQESGRRQEASAELNYYF